MAQDRTLIRDVAASMLRHGATILAGLILVPVLTRSLGAARFGYWSMLGTTAFLIGLCDLGLTSATLRAAAGADPAAAKRAARFAALNTAVLGLPCAGLCYWWMSSVTQKLPETQRADAALAALIALLAGVLHAMAQAARSYAHGQGRIVLLTRARAVAVAVQLLLSFAFLAVRPGLTAVACAYTLSVLTEGVLSLLAARDGVSAPGLPSSQERRELRQVGRHALTTNLAVAVAIRADLFVLERITSLDVMGAYAVASRVVDQAFTVIKQVSASLVPRLGARAQDRASTLRFGTVVLGLLTAAPFASLAVAGAPILALWAGSAIDQPLLAPVLAWLSAAAAVAALSEVAASALFLGGNPALGARATMAGAALNLTVSVLGAYWFGPPSVAAATLFGNLLSGAMVWIAVGEWQRLRLVEVAKLLAYPLLAGVLGGLLAMALRLAGLPGLVAVPLAAALGTAPIAGLVIARRAGLGIGTKGAPTACS